MVLLIEHMLGVMAPPLSFLASLILIQRVETLTLRTTNSSDVTLLVAWPG